MRIRTDVRFGSEADISERLKEAEPRSGFGLVLDDYGVSGGLESAL